MSSIGYNWRKSFPRRMGEKYRIYWHAMHPVTYDTKALYRAAFTKKEWKALLLLKERRADAINSNSYFKYKDPENEINMRLDLPKKYKGVVPAVTTLASDVTDQVRQEMLDWFNIYCEHDNVHSSIMMHLRQLLDTDQEKRSLNGLNTNRQLYAVWPELLPFLDRSVKHTIRNTKVKAKIPAHWDQSYVSNWMAREHMDEINYALTVIPMLEDKIDDNYPSYS